MSKVADIFETRCIYSSLPIYARVVWSILSTSLSSRLSLSNFQKQYATI